MNASPPPLEDAPSPWLAPVRAARIAGALGLALGLGFGAWEALVNPWVREFQAGDSSPLGERLEAFAQRVSVETLGFAALGAAAALLALAVSSGETRRHPDRFAGRCVEAFGAVILWVVGGVWAGDALLPLLEAPALAALGAAGVLGGLVAIRLVHPLVRMLPGGARSPHAATAVTCSLAMMAAAVWIQDRLFASGPRTSLRWIQAGGGALLLFASAAPLSALLRPAVLRLRLRMTQGRLVSRAVGRTGIALALACFLTTLAGLDLSPLPTELEYATLESDDLPDQPNVVLITIDTLRADHLGCYGYDRPTSPFLDSLAAEGTRFADPSAPASWTKPSTATILTGLHPSRHGALHHGSRLSLPEGERTLAEAFREGGYATAGFVTNPNVKGVFAFDRGFDEYFDSFVEDTVTLAAIRGSFFGRLLTAFSRHQFNWKYENDVLQMNAFIEPWLAKNRDQRFFLYLHYIDPHTPYHPPAEYRAQFLRDAGWSVHNERKRRVGIDLYDAEIRYVDDGLRALADEMERLGLWENTMVVVTSDHGEEFFEHGYDGHGFSLFQPVVGVPLIARGPGVPAGRVVEDPVQIVDLPATLLGAAGVADGTPDDPTARDGRFGDGASFASLLRGGPGPVGPYFLESEFGMGQDEHTSFIFRGVREGAFKLVRTEANKYFPEEARRDGGLALYDLERDPGERENLIRDEAYRELVESLLEQMRSHSEFLEREGLRGNAAAPLTRDLEEDLKALGYL